MSKAPVDAEKALAALLDGLGINAAWFLAFADEEADYRGLGRNFNIVASKHIANATKILTIPVLVDKENL